MTCENEPQAIDMVKIKGEIGLCRIPGCFEAADSRGLCSAHYQWYRSPHADRRAVFATYAEAHKDTKIKLACTDRTIYYLRSLVKRNASIFVDRKCIIAVDGDVVYQIMPDGTTRKAKFAK